jgi:hypothetical protein
MLRLSPPSDIRPLIYLVKGVLLNIYLVKGGASGEEREERREFKSAIINSDL